MPMISATWEARAGRSQVQGQPGHSKVLVKINQKGLEMKLSGRAPAWYMWGPKFNAQYKRLGENGWGQDSGVEERHTVRVPCPTTSPKYVNLLNWSPPWQNQCLGGVSSRFSIFYPTTGTGTGAWQQQVWNTQVKWWMDGCMNNRQGTWWQWKQCLVGQRCETSSPFHTETVLPAELGPLLITSQSQVKWASGDLTQRTLGLRSATGNKFDPRRYIKI